MGVLWLVSDQRPQGSKKLGKWVALQRTLPDTVPWVHAQVPLVFLTISFPKIPNFKKSGWLLAEEKTWSAWKMPLFVPSTSGQMISKEICAMSSWIFLYAVFWNLVNFSDLLFYQCIKEVMLVLLFQLIWRKASSPLFKHVWVKVSWNAHICWRRVNRMRRYVKSPNKEGTTSKRPTATSPNITLDRNHKGDGPTCPLESV